MCRDERYSARLNGDIICIIHITTVPAIKDTAWYAVFEKVTSFWRQRIVPRIYMYFIEMEFPSADDIFAAVKPWWNNDVPEILFHSQQTFSDFSD